MGLRCGCRLNNKPLFIYHVPHECIKFIGLHEGCRVIYCITIEIFRQCLKVLNPAVDLGLLGCPQIIRENTGFGFNDEIQVIPHAIIFVDKHGPVWVITPQWRIDFKPGWQLGVQLRVRA